MLSNFLFKPPLFPSLYTARNATIPHLKNRAAMHASFSSPAPSPSPPNNGNNTKIILFDVMDTLITDPFYQHMPNFFSMSFDELLQTKHPTAWVSFETGDIEEEELFTNFFADGRQFDGPALVEYMIDKYEWIEGMPEVLLNLSAAGYELHAFSNYPTWYKYIEKKLQLSRYLNWTFVSCEGALKGLRKPKKEAYSAVIDYFGRPAHELMFIDDRQANVDAALAAGMKALRFSGRVEELKKDLSSATGTDLFPSSSSGNSRSA